MGRARAGAQGGGHQNQEKGRGMEPVRGRRALNYQGGGGEEVMMKQRRGRTRVIKARAPVRRLHTPRGSRLCSERVGKKSTVYQLM